VIQAKSNNIPITRSVDNDDLAMSAGSIIASPLSNGANSLSGVNVHKSQSATSKSSRTNNTIALNNGSYMAPANFAVQIIPQRNKYCK
jgi:hypothetical protein